MKRSLAQLLHGIGIALSILFAFAMHVAQALVMVFLFVTVIASVLAGAAIAGVVFVLVRAVGRSA